MNSTPADIIRLQRLADALTVAMNANGNSMAEAVEALALIAAQKADTCHVGSVNEQSWTNACTHLFDLAQAGRLYRDPTTGAAVKAA